MEFAATTVHKEIWDVDRRLAELMLDRQKLLRVVSIALNEASNVSSPFHCVNAPGTMAYQQGTWALRSEFVGENWRIDRPEGVEAIWNDKLKTRVVFSNVDVCCNDFALPKPRSAKGAGAERVCIGNLFDDLPHYAPQEPNNVATFYLMVDENGAAELTRPVIQNKTFEACLERIFLSNGRPDGEAILDLDEDDAVDNFDPQVARI